MGLPGLVWLDTRTLTVLRIVAKKTGLMRTCSTSATEKSVAVGDAVGKFGETGDGQVVLFVRAGEMGNGGSKECSGMG